MNRRAFITSTVGSVGALAVTLCLPRPIYQDTYLGDIWFQAEWHLGDTGLRWVIGQVNTNKIVNKPILYSHVGKKVAVPVPDTDSYYMVSLPPGRKLLKIGEGVLIHPQYLASRIKGDDWNIQWHIRQPLDVNGANLFFETIGPKSTSE